MSQHDIGAEELTLPIKRTEGERLEERLTGNAYHNILPARYLRKDSNGDLVESQEELFERVAKNVALAEAVFEARQHDVEITVRPDQIKPDHPRRDELAAEVFGAGVGVEDDVETALTPYNVNKFAYETIVPELPPEINEHVESVAETFQESMEQLSFMPNSPTLMNAGDELQQLSACFVDSPEDDIDDIHQTAKEAAQVFQCLTAETKVHVEGKGVVSVADVEPGDEIRQRDDDTHRSQPVEATHAYQDSPVYSVETEAGIELTGTPNHELLVDGEWQRIDEIEPGDRLSVRLGWLPDTDETDELTGVGSGGQWSSSRVVSNDDIRTLHTEGLSDYAIADRLDCSPSTVQRRRADELDLKPNGTGGVEPGAVSFDRAAFDRLYRAGKTDGEIAEQLGVHATTVGQYRGRQSLEPNEQPAKTVDQPTRFSSELAELVGMWVGDGSTHQDGIRLHLNREETLEHADRLCRRLFDEGLDWRWEDGCYDAVLHSHEIKRWWLTNFGDAKPQASEARVPEQVWQANHDTVEAFLRGLFSTDGSLQKETYPRLWTASERLLDEVQQLLLGLGIPALAWESDSQQREYYNVGPTDGQGLERYADRVGFVDSRGETMERALEDTEFRGTTVGRVTESTWKLPVANVEQAGTATVYDVTVDGTHEYVANSVVSHNSGGGMGYAFWRLRPYGDAVGSTGGIASGPITFMRTFDQMCFPPGTRVLTPGGQRPIEELERGDVVIDENGERQPITETMERHVDEEIVEVTTERLNRTIRATGEHPFKVARDGEFVWVDADDLREDDLLVLGHAAEENTLRLDSNVALDEIASGPLVFTDGGIAVNRDYYGATKGPSPRAFTDEVGVEAFATLAGWYLAEGCVVYRRGMPSEVTFTLHSDERDAAERIQRALDSFGVSSRIETVEERNTLHVHAEHSSFAQFVDGLFGTGASEKRVPDVLWNAPVETQARVLEALFAGDGRLEKRGKSQRAKLKLANRDIVDFAFQAGLRCGVQFSRHDREPADRKATYEVGASVSSALGTPLECLFDEVPDEFEPRDRTKQFEGRDVVAVDSVERVEYEGPVYNAEVADTHTYVADDLVVHNCETIAQGGARRGAQMGVMRVSHPDVIQFIHAKNKDVSLANTLRLNDPDDFTHTSFAEALEEARELIDDEGRVPEYLRNAVEGHLSNFNISVGITDAFMDAVKNDEEYTFTNPRTDEPHVATPETEELYEMFDMGEHVEVGEVLSVPAQELWEHIVEGAHENGEPGLIYLERVNKEHSFDVEEHPDHRILATNPCLHGNMEVAVADGRESVPIADLATEDSPTPVYTLDDTGNLTIREADAFKTKKDADVVEVETDGETTLKLTPDHEVRTRNRGWVEAKNLESGDSLEILTEYDAPLGAVLGSAADADGTEYRWLNTGTRANQAEHRLIASHSGEEIDGKVIHHKNHDSLDNRPENLVAMSKEDHDALHDISGESNPINILKERGEFEAFKERNPFYDVDGEDNPMHGRSNNWAGLVDWECSRDDCSETMELPPAKANHRKYCSRDCANKAKEVHVEFDCQSCGKTIVAHGSGAKDRKYCDRACAAEDTLEGDTKKAFLRHLYVDNPMQREAVKEQKIADTDYEAVGEAISETRQEKIESGKLEVEVRDHGEVVCRECGETFGAVTNTHLESAHGMTTEEYKQEYPEACLHSKQPVVTENHKVTAVSAVGSADVYDLSVPETHNFYAGLNTRENSETRKDVFVNVHNCGEQPLEEYEACNLGHINLSTLAAEDAPDWRLWSDRYGDDYESLDAAIESFLADAIDWEAFDRRIELGARFLENVVTMSDFPVEEIEQTVREMRKIGLGIMGLAQLYIQLGVKYGSDPANEIARQLMTHINHESKWTSHRLAKQRGTFEEWDNSKYADPTEYREWFERQTGLDAEEWADGFPMRNHNTTTIAPTGCVEERSLVSTDDGLREIADLDETTAEFEQWSEIEVGVSTDGGTKTATAIYDNGFADVRRIETEGGFSVAATPDHRFRTITEDGEYAWREADEFEPGDRILLQRNTFDGSSRAALDTTERENYYHNTDDGLRLPEEMTPALAEFLGYFVGDGYVHDEVGVKLVVDSEAAELDGYLRDLGESVFGVTPTVEERDTRHVLVFGGRHLPRYFADNGWKKDAGNEGDGAASAFVPEEVLRGDEAVAKAFLRGLFEADGTASRKVELSTVSSTLADQVQTLLLSLGCVFVRDVLEMDRRDDHYGDRPRHTLRGANKREDKRFLDEIGFVTKSTELELTAQSYKNDTYPPALVDALRAVDGYEDVSKPVKKRVNQSPLNGSVSRKLVGDIEEETGETVRLDGHRLADLYAAPVESVTEETAYTKDISVPSNNTYVANGFVTHNTTSMVGNTTGGCEPIYNVAYYKNVSDDVQGEEMLVEFDDYFLRVLEDNDIDVETVKSEAKEQMANNEFDGVESLSTVPDSISELFVTTGDLSAKQHASVQTACQEGVDSAISKTVNAPSDSTVEDAKEVFQYIYDHGGKGVTYYRDGTRSKQVLTTRAQNTEFAEMDEQEALTFVVEQIEERFGGIEAFLEHEEIRERLAGDFDELFVETAETSPYAEKKPRPDQLHGVTQRIETGYGKLYVTINEDPGTGEPFELFANTGHSGGFTNSFTDALAKTISVALRSGVDPYEIVDKLQGIRSPKVAWDKGEQINSIPDAFGTALRRYLDDEIDRAYPDQATLEQTASDGTDERGEREREETQDRFEASEPETDGGAAAARSAAEIESDHQSVVDAGENPECPDCGSLSLYYSEGCKTCESCGWSEC